MWEEIGISAQGSPKGRRLLGCGSEVLFLSVASAIAKPSDLRFSRAETIILQSPVSACNEQSDNLRVHSWGNTVINNFLLSKDLIDVPSYEWTIFKSKLRENT